MDTLPKRFLTAAVVAAAPVGVLFLLAQTDARRSEAWNAVLGSPVAGIELGLLIIGSGPVLGVILLLGHAPLRAYLAQRLLGTAILVAGLLAIWSQSPVFEGSAERALEHGGFQLWGRVLASLLAVAAFRRLTRSAPASGG